MHSYRTYSDFELLDILKDDDINAFNEIYSRYFKKLYNHAYEKLNDPILADEVLQELFISFWTNRAKVDVKKSLSSYFFVSIRYIIINQLKKQMRYESNMEQVVLTYSNSSDNALEWVYYVDLFTRWSKYNPGFTLLQISGFDFLYCHAAIKCTTHQAKNRSILQGSFLLPAHDVQLYQGHQ